MISSMFNVSNVYFGEFHLSLNSSSASVISGKIPKSAQTLWMKRDQMDLIVLIDEDTSESQTADSQKPIWIMREILLQVSK